MITIIGSGKVGSAIAFLIASNSLDDVILLNRTKSKAIGESLDISNSIPSNSKIKITAEDDYAKIKDSKIIIITASTATYVHSRTEMIRDQVAMIQSIADKIKQFNPNSIILIVSNPVDVLTYFFLKRTGFQKNKVIGIASSLDTSRLRFLVAQKLDTTQNKIENALVMGEHGDSMVPIYSRMTFENEPVTNILSSKDLTEITIQLRDYWKTLRKYKSRSVFGIAKNTHDLLCPILSNKPIFTSGSVLLEGEYGISNIPLGCPLEIDGGGVNKILEIPLREDEKISLVKSSNIIRGYIQEISGAS